MRRIRSKTRVTSLVIFSLVTFFLQAPSSHTLGSAAEVNPGLLAVFQNFYAPVSGSICPNGIVTVSRPDKKSFVEYDNFSLTVSNSKNLVLGSSIYTTFATEDNSKEIDLPVKICGDDKNYLGQDEPYTLQIKFVSSDRKFAQEIALTFNLIPLDEKARSAQVVRDNCESTGLNYNPYFINYNIEKSSSVRKGKTFFIAGTLYRFGYPADLESLKVVVNSYSPYRQTLIASSTTDKNGKFKLSWKIKNGGIHQLVVEERIRPVGPYYGVFDSMEMPLFIECFGDCKYVRSVASNASWEGKPTKSIGQCAIAKHEYSLITSSPAVSSSGIADRDRNLWIKSLIAVSNSLSNPSILQSKETSAYVADPGAGSSYQFSKGSGGGSVWVKGHFRNGKYVRGYSRRKG